MGGVMVSEPMWQTPMVPWCTSCEISRSFHSQENHVSPKATSWVRDLFQQAEKLAPCIIFIDELDALGKARGISGLAGNDEREQILKVHAKRLTLGQDVDLRAVAGKTAGLAGADLANIVNEAALHAARKNKTVVEMSDFDEAIDRAITGLERKSRVMNAKERETVAYQALSREAIAAF
jgi:ATP-dependent Zn protease